ncbi:hypothetical protein BDN72DRAFT_883530 [Pluteus cervinus]|uniref:Uncharacterized protein n=1 Tax=Pluteus cervinus TaxID=181527 RepID=A0ACD3A4M5_9AGAR|nr:hypothetical protein BDN72DRAFT_883530 [Pluteus cervinus]
MTQNPAGEIQTGSTLHVESPQLHIIALTMEHKPSFMRKFKAEICVLNDTSTVKQCNSDKETVKKGKLQWKFGVLVPIGSELVFKILKCHTLTSDEVITTVSVSFTDILKYFKDNKQSGMINSITKTVLGVFSKVYEQLGKQELCTQQIAELFDRIKLLEPLLVKVQKLDTFENLQKTVQDILILVQEVLEAIFKYNSSLGFIAQLLDQHKGQPVLDVQKFSTSFKNLYDAFNTSLQVDLAYNLEQQEINLTLNELKPNLKHPAAFCAQDTCLDIFTELDRWAKTQSEKLFWLYGMAGMGKSTIAATFSNILKAEKLLGAYHICSRDTPMHQSPTQLVLNLCYQLSLVYKPFGKLVAKTIKEDSLFTPSGMPITELFKLLFLQPLGVIKGSQFKPATVIFIIDALDECGSSEERQDVIQKLEELINSITKTVLGVFSKVYEQLEKQELSTQQISELFDQIKLLYPLLVKARELDTFENLQQIIQDLLSLVQEALEAVHKYSSLGLMGQLLDQHKPKPILEVQKFSTRFKSLYSAFNTSLQVDFAYNWKLDRWAKTQPEKLFWLHGVAGMGKSTIAATLSNILRAEKLLGAYHICSRDTTAHQNPTQLVLNLCYQLSLVYKPFGKLVAKMIKEDSLFSPSGMPITGLFDLLFFQPLCIIKERQSKPATVVLIIDALDECGSSEERQDIIQKLEELVGCCDWIKVLITSRPNVDVQGSLLNEKLTLWSLNPRDNDGNIERFFKHKFEHNLEFRGDKNRLLKAVPALTKHAGGLFIWAKTACEYLNSGLAIAKGLDKLLQSEAHHNLHFLYETVLSNAVPSDDNHAYQIVMSAILLAGESLSEKGLAGLLSEEEELEESTVERVVLRLKALVYVGSDQRLYIIHPSLREYLTNPQLCPQMFYIGSEQHFILFQKTVNVLQLQLKFNICGLESSYELNNEVKDLKDRMDRHISEELGYSTRYWMYHMVSSGEWSSSYDSTLEVMKKENTLLYWVEVLSLLGCVRKTMLEMAKVIQWMKI